MEEVWSQLKPTSSAGRGEWLDLSGLILPREELDRLIEKVEEGEIASLEAIEEFFAAMLPIIMIWNGHGRMICWKSITV